jgi:hypothetical protein
MAAKKEMGKVAATVSKKGARRERGLGATPKYGGGSYMDGQHVKFDGNTRTHAFVYRIHYEWILYTHMDVGVSITIRFALIFQ